MLIRTVVIMDKASFHRSKKIQEKINELRDKKIEIFWLPSYSPSIEFNRDSLAIYEL